MEKMEFLYLSPYYLQATFFMLGTLSWFISEAVFQVRLPFWTSIWGWSLVFTNLFSLPLMNTVGLFLEESNKRDYGGILSFIFLTYLVTPFQGYAALKGFLETKEGPWFRTPKTGKITDIFTPGRFARLISMIFPGRRTNPAASFLGRSDLFEVSDRGQTSWVLGRLGVLGGVGANLAYLRLSRRRVRWMANLVIVILVLTSIALTYVSFPLTPTLAYTGTFYFKNTSADDLTDTSTDARKQMIRTIANSTQSFTLNATNTTFYVLTDNMNKKWSADKEFPTEGTTSEQRNPDIATDSSGNTFAVWEDERNSQNLGTWTQSGASTYGRAIHTATLLGNGKVLVAGTYWGNAGQSIAELYDPATQTFSTTAPSTYPRYWQTASLLASGRVLAVGSGFGNAGQSIAELYDPQTSTFSTTGAMTYARYLQTATLLGNGKVLVVGTSLGNGGVSIAELYDPQTQTWVTTGPSTYSRSGHSATLLQNGKVLVVGASSGGGYTIAELFDPQTQTFSIAATSNYLRWNHTATLLNNGKVLLAGNDLGDPGKTIPEIYDPATGTFSTTGPSTYPRVYHTATLLGNGKVLLAGTDSANEGETIAEIYDPASGTFSTTAPSTYGRDTFTATLLNNGKVLLAGTELTNGGQSIPELYTPKTSDIYMAKYDKDGARASGWSADVRVNSDDGNRSTSLTAIANYDHLNPKVKLDSSGNPIVVWQEARNSIYGDDIWAQKLSATDGSKLWPAATTGTWITTGAATYNRDGYQTVTSLSNGRILVVGSGSAGRTIAEIYDPSTSTFTTTAPSSYRRESHTATLLNTGKILVAGASSTNAGHSIAELYDPATNTFSTTPPSAYGRQEHTATPLDNGKVLVAGTNSTIPSPAGQSVAELYDPSTGTFATTGTMTYGRYNHTATLIQNGKVLVVGRDTVNTNAGQTVPELYDPSTGTWSALSSSTYARGDHTTTLLNNGEILVVGTDYINAGRTVPELYDPSTGTFATTGASTYQRANHTATLLNNGRVLVVGTGMTNGGVTIPEIYDPATGTFTTTGTSAYIRYQQTATLLNNGKVLAVGTGGDNDGLSVPEIYTPVGDIQVSNDGSPTNGYGLPRPEYPDNAKGILGEQRNPVLAVDSSNNAVVAWEDTRFAAIQNWGLSFNYDSNAWRQTNINLGASNVCNGGGATNNSCGAIPLIQNNPLRIMGQKLDSTTGAKYWGDDVDGVNKNNPQDIGLASTGDFSSKPAIAVDGTNVVVTWESNGKKERDRETRNYDIYGQKFNSDGLSQWGGTWSRANKSSYRYNLNTATLLNNGKVLVTGSTTDILASMAEIYDPSTSTWITTGFMAYERYEHTATLLGSGKVLTVGTGFGNDGRTIPELYDPSTGTFTTTAPLTYARNVHTATLLLNGKVLTVGTGWGSGGETIPEIYDPVTNTWTTTGSSSYVRTSSGATLLGNGKVLVVGTSSPDEAMSTAEIYDPQTGTWSATGSMLYKRYYLTATLLNSGRVLVVGTGVANPGETVAELYDPQSGTWATTGALTYFRYAHTANLLPSGKVLVAGASLSNSGRSIPELYDPQTGTWTLTGALTYARGYNTATLLGGGKIFVVGSAVAGGAAGETIPEIYSLDQMISSGVDLADQRYPDVAVDTGSNYIFAWQGRRGSGAGGGPYNGDSDRGGGSWKVYGQKTNSSGTAQWGGNNTFSAVGNMPNRRDEHTATILSNGKVLVAGGETTGFNYLSQAEIYDPSTQTFSTVDNMSNSRHLHTATFLTNGKVLIAGGNSNSVNVLSQAELFDPATLSFTSVGNMPNARERHTATLLANGKVLVSGGAYYSGGWLYLSQAELYDPSTQTFSTVGNMSANRGLPTATLLSNGKVLIAGGFTGSVYLSQAELFDPATSTFSAVGNMPNSRSQHTATLLNNGKVLISGGFNGEGGGTDLSQAEIYDPATQTFSAVGNMTYAREYHSAVLLSNGKVLIAGGRYSSGSVIYLSQAELYDPSTNAFSNVGNMPNSRYRHTATLLSNGKVLVAGGYNGAYLSQAELYNPAGELMLSHDEALGRNQERPRLAVDGTTIYAAWQDNRSAISNTLTSDFNIFMQKYDGSTGSPQWPAASSGAGYSSPYAVSDIRADTFKSSTNGWGSHYSGRPAIGGVYTGASGEKPFIVAWEDNRNSGDGRDIYAQSYDTLEQDISKTNNWDVFWDHDLATVNLSVNVGITEWDGATYSEKGQGTAQTWNVSSDPAGEDTLQWSTGGSPPPPSDQIGNITMRRLIVTFTRVSGSVTIYYDNDGAGYNSRLGTGDVVPEKVLFLGLVIPFLPPVIQWYRRRRKREEYRYSVVSI